MIIFYLYDHYHYPNYYYCYRINVSTADSTSAWFNSTPKAVISTELISSTIILVTSHTLISRDYNDYWVTTVV